MVELRDVKYAWELADLSLDIVNQCKTLVGYMTVSEQRNVT